MGGKGGVAIAIDQNRAAPDAAGGPRRHLSLLDAMCVVVGIVIGVGIFRSPSLVAAMSGTPTLMVVAWVLGGVLCFAGALTYTELASAYPRVGGEFVYLDRAFGGAVSFLFVWARVTVIQTGTIAATAYVFGDYMARVAPVGTAGPLVWALAAASVLTITNLVGLKTGKWTQNGLTAVKVAGVVAIAVLGLGFAPSAPADAAPQADGGGPSLAGFGLAMIFVLYTFGGWNEAAYVAGELKTPRRNTLRLLVGSIALLTVVYVAVNLAYLHVLGFEGMGKSSAVAADAVAAVFGAGGGAAVSVLVAISALGAINGCIFTGARAICGLGEDHRVFASLGRWSGRFGTPATAIVVQSAIAVVLILLPALGGGLSERLGSGFEEAVTYTAPAFWAFFLLTGVAVFVLRAKEPQVERPFRVPLYPVPVIVFCGMCAWMLYRSLDYRALGAVVGVVVLLVGVPVYLASRRKAGRHKPDGA